MDKQQQAEKQGIPQYRCQRCSGGHMDLKAPHVPVAVLRLFVADPLAPEANGIRRLVMHDCDDGGTGLAVIVGMFPAERLPEFEAALAKEEAQRAAARSHLVSSAN